MSVILTKRYATLYMNIMTHFFINYNKNYSNNTYFNNNINMKKKNKNTTTNTTSSSTNITNKNNNNNKLYFYSPNIHSLCQYHLSLDVYKKCSVPLAVFKLL